MQLSGKQQLALGLTAATVAGGAAVSHGLTHYLVNVAVDRKFPNSANRLTRAVIRGSRCDRVFLQALDAGAQVLRNLPHKTISIRGKDGAPLVGHLFAAAKPKRLVLAMHGWRSSWDHDFGMIAPFLLANDCTVLFAEQRGQGGSGGKHMGLGALERYDCVRWAHRLADMGPHLPLYLAGISMGATTVLMATGFPLPSNVHGVIADCGYTSPGAIFHHVAKHNLHLPYGKLRKAMVGRLCRKRLREDPEGYSCQQALRHCRVPVLFIHGTEDTFVPISMTYENYQACTGPKELFVVPGAGHGTSYLVDGPGYEKRLLEFFCQYD